MFSKQNAVMTCLAAICANRGIVDLIQVVRANRRATYGVYCILILQFFVTAFSVA